MFYGIVNDGTEATIECFTLLGLSTTRGTDGTIGRFGTGFKHAVSLFLRNEWQFCLCIGDKMHKFSQRPIVNRGKEFNQVYVDDKPLAFVQEMGTQDWNDVRMAMREIISNALDNQYLHSKNYDIKILEADEPYTIPGSTVVWFEKNYHSENYMENLGYYFLHLRDPELLKQALIPKDEPSNVCVYKNGVLAGTFPSLSIYDYNLDNTFKINESRVLDKDSVINAVGGVWGKVNNLEALTKFVKVQNRVDRDYIETQIREFGVSNSKLPAACVEAFGENYAICSWLGSTDVEAITRNGYTPILVHNYYMFKYSECRLAENITPEEDKRYIDVKKLDAEDTFVIKQLWTKLCNYSGFDTPMPRFKIAAFKGSNEICSNLNGTVYLNKVADREIAVIYAFTYEAGSLQTAEIVKNLLERIDATI